MAISNSYPQINNLASDDLLLVTDVSQDNSTKSVTMQTLANYMGSSVRLMTFATYADMIAFGTPLNATITRVLNDENKGLENTEYRIFPDGTRMWIANTEDN